MSFLQSSSIIFEEFEYRKKAMEGILSFGVQYLDDAMVGILKNDLVLIGAGSGAGKTQLCCNIARANIEKGKRVHFIALEAEIYEIERRIKYQLFLREFLKQKQEYYSLRGLYNPNLDDAPEEFLAKESRYKQEITFTKWSLGQYSPLLDDIDARVSSDFMKQYSEMYTFYKSDKFTIDDLIKTVTVCADETDLIIIDHVHYFDYDNEKENTSIKEIAKTARMLALENGKPIILISHMRKRDRSLDELAPGLEEFHGSSDLYKIATKAITIGSGGWDPQNGKLETFFRIVKNRMDSSVTRCIASVNFIPKEGNYETEYKIGDANQKRADGFTRLLGDNIPTWAIHNKHETTTHDSNNRHVAQGQFPPNKFKNGQGPVKELQNFAPRN